MKKEEIQNKLDEATKRRMEISDNILGLKEQLAEAEKLEKLDKFLEKPKLGHGDFGSGRGSNWLVAQRNDNLEVFGDKSGCGSLYSHESEDVILGNVFDLMKGWSEELEGFLVRNRHFRIDFESAMYPFKIADCWFTLAETEEICHKLPRLIATRKRKQNKT